jgi:hypothetical protein
VRKHTGRIRARTEDPLPVWDFLNASSWVDADWMITLFYSGLGVALFLCGVRFLGVFARQDVLVPEPEWLRSDT